MTLQWQSDDHGCLVTRPFGEDAGYLYIQARRTYCDRGHWEWGYIGIPGEPTAEPSYYFMRKETAIAEVQAWLGQRMGVDPASDSLNSMAIGEVRNFGEGARALGGQWTREGGNKIQALLSDPEEGGELLATIREVQEGKRTAFILTMSGIANLDDSDRFPRTYLNLENAIQETEDFLVWRLLKKPTQIPDRIVDEVYDWPQEIEKACQAFEKAGAAPAARKRKPG